MSTHTPVNTCMHEPRCQKITCRSWFSFPTVWVLGIIIRLVTSTLPKSHLPSPQSRVLEMKTRASLSSVCILPIPDSVPKSDLSSLREYLRITGRYGDGSLREIHTHAQLYLSECFSFALEFHLKSVCKESFNKNSRSASKRKGKETGKRWSLITKFTRRLMADTLDNDFLLLFSLAFVFVLPFLKQFTSLRGPGRSCVWGLKLCTVPPSCTVYWLRN